MGSKSVDLLNELRNRSQIDCDTLDVARGYYRRPAIPSG